jgi:hypothetical protein
LSLAHNLVFHHRHANVPIVQRRPLDSKHVWVPL